MSLYHISLGPANLKGYNYRTMFEYDPFQKKAIAAIDQEKSVLVSAPTGAGKTAIAEYAIEKAFTRNERVIYTSPIKALSNQKYRDFSARYPGEVGILTGDVTLNSHAPLVIMTTEIYRNQLFEDPKRLENTSWVIFDEVHYLDDPQRGTVWEEAIMFSPSHIRFLALSATAPNIDELAQWIGSILEHSIEVIIEPHRPVPLIHLFQCQGLILPDVKSLKKEGYLNREHWARNRGGFHQKKRFHRSRWENELRAKPNRADEIIRSIAKDRRMPCIYFAFGRKRTEELAWEAQRFDFVTANEKVEIQTLYRNLCERFDLLKEKSALEIEPLVSRGIAFHHAGMIPSLKEVIEQLFTSKLIKLIFTTETFALGINMPAKSVVFDELRKFYGTHFANLRTRDFYQMAGRAGRRGMDEAGFVYSRVNPHEVPFPAVERMIYGKPELIESQFNSCYATLLNLYGQFGEKLMQIYPRSFHYFQSNKRDREKGAWSIEKKLNLLHEMGYFANKRLSAKGEFASWMYGYELILSELLEEGYLETLDELRLAVLLSSLVYEPRRNETAQKLTANFLAIEKRVEKISRTIHHKESVHKIFPLTKLAYFHLARALEAWMGGCLFTELERHTEADEGEIIRYFRMVIQLLRQLRQAPQVSERLKQTAANAIKKINRDLVDAEKQLRNI